MKFEDLFGAIFEQLRRSTPIEDVRRTMRTIDTLMTELKRSPSDRNMIEDIKMQARTLELYLRQYSDPYKGANLEQTDIRRAKQLISAAKRL